MFIWQYSYYFHKYIYRKKVLMKLLLYSCFTIPSWIMYVFTICLKVCLLLKWLHWSSSGYKSVESEFTCVTSALCSRRRFQCSAGYMNLKLVIQTGYMKHPFTPPIKNVSTDFVEIFWTWTNKYQLITLYIVAHNDVDRFWWNCQEFLTMT